MKIPKIIHHTWIGDDPLPPEAADNINTWKRYHPEWRFQLWTRENIPLLHNQTLYHAHSNTGHRADILRYELLHQFGGVYADVDMVCHRSIEPVLGEMSAFASSHGEHGEEGQGLRWWWPEIAFMGSVPGHPFFGELVLGLAAFYAAHEQEPASDRTGPGYFGALLSRWKTEQWRTIEDDVAIFPPKYFMPYTFCEKDEGRKRFYPEAYAEHLWWGSWVTQGALSEAAA